jgi:hypothetical protein
MTVPTSIAPYVPARRVRCPLALAAPRFEGNVCRCVLPDTHAGVCLLIDGDPLTAEAYPPRARYRLMGLPVPDALPSEAMASPRRRLVGKVALVLVAGALAIASLVILRALGWIE